MQVPFSSDLIQTRASLFEGSLYIRYAVEPQ